MLKYSHIKDPQAPDFLKFKGNTFSKELNVVRKTVTHSKIATVCEEASCPNKTECWSSGTATFMLMGDTCTRGCKFCNVKTAKSPPPLDPQEPENLATALYDWDVNYIVITSVDRDDMEDGGSVHLAECIEAVKNEHPNIKIEILMPDFKGQKADIERIIDANPEVLAHNIETVRRLTPIVRDRRATYDQSIKVLAHIKNINPDAYTKSSIMVGLSETKEEVIQTMKDLREVDVDFLTIGQYMRPTLRHLPVKEYLNPEIFEEYRILGEKMGFKYVASGPLVRSSYKAGEYFIANILDSKESN
ncbi:MAG: Lipoyl synthase [Candidatus Heimdallarchaeota archaeon LC_2]|nr:MAG: Lipoyl synthase [Candidatus Heimdallarchaeota archaeon LC_2]